MGKARIYMLISFLMILVSCVLFAQTLIDTIPLIVTEDTIIDVYENSETGEVFKVFANDLGLRILEQRPTTHMLAQAYQYGLLWQNGKRLLFDKDEKFVDFKNSYILTGKEFWDRYLKDYKWNFIKYTLLQRSLLANEDNLIIYKANEFIFLGNGNIVTTNFRDSFGTEINIYSPDFKLIETYNPYMMGFTNVSIATNNKVIIAVVYPTRAHQDNMLKLLFINADSGNLLFEKELYNNFSTSRIYPVNNFFVLYGDGWFNAVNNKGRIIWDRSFDKPTFVTSGMESKYFYVLTNKELFSLKKKNGSTNWSKKLESVYKSKLDEELAGVSDIKIKPLGIYSIFDGEYAGLLVGQSRQGLNTKKFIYNVALYLFDKKGELQKTIECCERTRFVKVLPNDNSFKIITDDEIKIYTK
ncbi:MAG: hypothetical protein H8E11_05900 [Candidatus Cloacimonetes bacterium]|nr:hypothetical protein [Candidatus Cloacimonadota bacterium]